jgi:hypothetical protein
MSRIARRAGDARLSRNGTVKLGGTIVGIWWRDDNDLYHFAERPEAEPSVTRPLRHELMSAIPDYLSTT